MITRLGWGWLDWLLDFSLALPLDYKLRGFKLRWFFKEALREWLIKHQGELGNDWPGFDQSITELADALDSNDESEVIECEEHVLRTQAEAESQSVLIDD